MISETVNIVSIMPSGDYRLHLHFDDGTDQDVDFRPFLMHSLHPDIRAFLDPVRFSTFRIEHGELVWGDYELCFPMSDLYQNCIETRSSFGMAA